MAILKKENVVKVKNSPYEIESLLKQGFEIVDEVEPKLQPLAENPVIEESEEVSEEIKVKKGGKKS